MTDPGATHPSGYRDLAALLRAQITDGTLPPGWALPSERTLRETYGLGKHTVRQAMAVLRTEGLVVVRAGYGATVRIPADQETVTVGPGYAITSRMPTPAERDRHDIADGVPVVHILRPDGTGDIYPADRIRIVVAADPPPGISDTGCA